MCRRRRPGFRRADNLPRLPDAAAVRHRSGPAPSAPTVRVPQPPRSAFSVETDLRTGRSRPHRAEWPRLVTVPASARR